MKAQVRYLVVVVAALVAAVALPPVGQAAQGGLSLVVDRSSKRLSVEENGRVVQSYAVPVGMPGHRTPAGEFEIRHMNGTRAGRRRQGRGQSTSATRRQDRRTIRWGA